MSMKTFQVNGINAAIIEIDVQQIDEEICQAAVKLKVGEQQFDLLFQDDITEDGERDGCFMIGHEFELSATDVYQKLFIALGGSIDEDGLPVDADRFDWAINRITGWGAV